MPRLCLLLRAGALLPHGSPVGVTGWVKFRERHPSTMARHP